MTSKHVTLIEGAKFARAIALDVIAKEDKSRELEAGEPPSVVIYVLDGGLNNDRDRAWRFGGYTLTREAGEAACEAHALEWGYGSITWTRHDDDKSVGYVTTPGYGYSVTRVVVSNEVQP